MHKHDWIPMKTSPTDYGRKTEIYLACHCGKTRLKTRKGRWELSDLKFAKELKEKDAS